MKKFLIIQTAFIGDVILATSLIEAVRKHFPGARIDFLLRKGNENLLVHHPHLEKVYVLEKNSRKYAHVFQMIRMLRKTRYDYLLNLQRYFTTGIITLFARSHWKAGFDKNPFSWAYHYKVRHTIGDGKHEIERNMELLAPLTEMQFVRPRLYPAEKQYDHVHSYQNRVYVCIAPASVWYTKQFPKEKWISLITDLNPAYAVYLIGSAADYDLCQEIATSSGRKEVQNLCGRFSLLETAALMQKAKMNYVNDSAPLHLASAMNAPVTAVFCSTIPEFGFYPVSDDATVVETDVDLYCRPCGLHGFNACPEGHFKCARTIDVRKLLLL